MTANSAGEKSKKKAWKKEGEFKDKTEGNDAEKKPASSSATGRAAKLYDGK